MNEQMRQALTFAADVDFDASAAEISDRLLTPAATPNEPAPGFKIDAHPSDSTGAMLRLWWGNVHVISSCDRKFLVRQSWHRFRKTDSRKWVLA